MITIDMLDERVSLPEKPKYRYPAPVQYIAPGQYLAFHHQVQDYHRGLIVAAHTARLLKLMKTRQLAVEVYRFVHSIKSDMSTLAERYIHRSTHLA